MNLKLPKLNKPKRNITQKTNLELLKRPEYARKYKEQLNEKQNESKDNDERWKNTVEKCLLTGKEVLGPKEKTNKPQKTKPSNS